MTGKDNAKLILAGLDAFFPNPECELNFETPFQLLVAVILSAQCTDKRVNEVSKELFKVCKTPQDFVAIPQEELEKLVHSCGFYHNKAKAIKNASREILEKFNGEVPNDFNKLCSLPGVGRKTANVVMSVAFKEDAFAVDTHVLRLANRLSLVKTKDAHVCEAELKKIFPKNTWSKLHHQMVLFGRYKCKAIKPDCKDCPFSQICCDARNF